MRRDAWVLVPCRGGPVYVLAMCLELPTPALLLRDSRCLVVKLGSSLIAPPGDAAGADLASIARDLAEIAARPGGAVTVVSSGAVALGRGGASLPGRGTAIRQALSAIGQTALMGLWQEAFSQTGLTVAQVLLTADVTEDRQRYLNARAALRVLHEAGVVPIVNENDAVATEELRAGDNDALAARTAGLIGADTLVLLSDVDGLYTGPPSQVGSVHVPFVSRASAKALDTASMQSVSGVGTGGMASKVRAATLAASWGVGVVIASGRERAPLTALADGSARGTVFEASSHASARRRWLAGRGASRARLRVDEGAAAALRSGASLLAVGVTGRDGAFTAGDFVEVVEEGGRTVGFGLVGCDADGLSASRGQVVIHRDDLVVED